MRENGPTSLMVSGEATGRMRKASTMRAARRLLRQSIAIRKWPLWSLQPRWLVAFVLTVIDADLAAIGVTASSTVITGGNLALFGLLLGCTVISVELTRKAGEHL